MKELQQTFLWEKHWNMSGSCFAVGSAAAAQGLPAHYNKSVQSQW